ncbi:MAG: hypothetical protein J6I65_04295 [Lachnospiraceae bacterium]|nr:hypothetical protein [Lachnospiraceae bacterium]
MGQKQTLKSAFRELPKKERILLITQTILSFIVLILAIVGTHDNFKNQYSINCIAVFFLVLIMVVNALRALPTNKWRAVIYFLVAAVMAGLWFMGLYQLFR